MARRSSSRHPSWHLAGRLSTNDLLKIDLTAAMKARDTLRVKTLRALLSTIDNAGAVPFELGRYEQKLGLGHDVPRREVTEQEVADRLHAGHSDLLQAAEEMRRHGQTERASELELRAAIVAGYLQ